MDTHKDMMLTFDRELSEAWEAIWNFKQMSFSEFIKEVLAKEHLKYSIAGITEAVRQISGTLPTQLDYKTLREEMIGAQLKDYEQDLRSTPLSPPASGGKRDHACVGELPPVHGGTEGGTA